MNQRPAGFLAENPEIVAEREAKVQAKAEADKESLSTATKSAPAETTNAPQERPHL